MKTEAYKVIMSRGPEIRIDQDELPKIMQSIETGMPVKVRQGIFNPSFWVSVVTDEERVGAARREMENIRKLNALSGEQKEWNGIQSLKDIFGETKLRLTK